jgi:O-acetylserine/cysteine efflux transporter
VRGRDVILALAVVAVWGANFVAIDAGLDELPPLLFVAVRFLLTAVPAVFLVPRPDVGWRAVVALGLLMCVGQFGLLFVGMALGMPAGLSSVVMQSQAVFTVLIAAAVLGERPRRAQLAGLGIAAAGVAVIGADRGDAVPLVALLLLLAGSACWGGANVVTRAARPARPFSLLVWSSLVAPVPLAGLSLVLEGPRRIAGSVATAGAATLWSLLYIVVLATFFGFGAWYRLLARYDSSVVAPFSLLVPVTGLSSAWLLLGERPTALQLTGSLVAIAGVGLVVHGARASRPRSTPDVVAAPAEAAIRPTRKP